MTHHLQQGTEPMAADDILDDLFHFCALKAYLEQAAIERGPPDSEATRRRAYQLYETELAERNRANAAS